MCTVSSSCNAAQATAVVSKLLSYAHYIHVGGSPAEGILSGYIGSYAEWVAELVSRSAPPGRVPTAARLHREAAFGM